PGGPYGPGGTSGPGGGSGPAGMGNRMSPMVADVQVLLGIISFYESYAQQNATDPKLRFDAARTYRRIGEIQSLLRRPTEAEPNLLKAIAMCEELLPQHPNPVDARREIILAADRLPDLTKEDAKFPERLRLFQRFVPYASDAPPMVAANFLDKVATMLISLGHYEQAANLKLLAEKLRSQPGLRPGGPGGGAGGGGPGAGFGGFSPR
ncbi:MAG: hypothetical protein ACRCZF_12170, partial [Gemmataceae bacterium]